ncbi:type II toxin-antitoxin system RelE/ParE family toxin [Cellvibrio mixtus]|uniref:type II toxin-antitoxin system RelE/ParE family toxin n=1 Tax=Cellvibrio mixtus TaxID=39650 RepID=UPI0005869D52|nr:type II toxin-antitoxin system RelE/ParE family toxin [Cellvibrio mixtus]
MKKYRVTPRARDDLKSIARYTQHQWGKLQRDKYLKLLEQRFEWIGENPLSGKNRNDICAGYYSFPHGEHLVFYRLGAGVIDVIGVLHQDMDVEYYFNTWH